MHVSKDPMPTCQQPECLNKGQWSAQQTVSKWETWCFTPSRPVRLHQGEYTQALRNSRIIRMTITDAPQWSTKTIHKQKIAPCGLIKVFFHLNWNTKKSTAQEHATPQRCDCTWTKSAGWAAPDRQRGWQGGWQPPWWPGRTGWRPGGARWGRWGQQRGRRTGLPPGCPADRTLASTVSDRHKNKTVLSTFCGMRVGVSGWGKQFWGHSQLWWGVGGTLGSLSICKIIGVSTLVKFVCTCISVCMDNDGNPTFLRHLFYLSFPLSFILKCTKSLDLAHCSGLSVCQCLHVNGPGSFSNTHKSVYDLYKYHWKTVKQVLLEINQSNKYHWKSINHSALVSFLTSSSHHFINTCVNAYSLINSTAKNSTK